MKRVWSFVLTVGLSVGICSAASHLSIRWLKMKVNWGGHKHYGAENLKPVALLHSSSPGYDAIDWDQVSEFLSVGIESWATPGSSPAEWEMMHSRSPEAKRFIVAVTPADLNENSVSDFRANIVPVTQTIRDLREAGSDWQFSKKTLSQYPIFAVRLLFPTAGRADGVMVGVRANLQKLAGRDVDAGEAPKFAVTGKSTIDEKLSEWPDDRLQRRLLLLRSAIAGEHPFDGPKKVALTRLLKRAQAEGPVLVLVLPSSPTYMEELGSAGARAFEGEIAALQASHPKIPFVRLDGISELNSNDYYYDPMHLNMFGQEIATRNFLIRLKELPILNALSAR
jgi:hypothetical protein